MRRGWEEALEGEEEALHQQLVDLEITEEEFKRAISRLRSDARAEIEEEAQEAYDRVIGGW